MTTTTAIKLGDVVTGTPVGQKRRQTMCVTRLDADGYLIGLLVSRKHPGNYRGSAVMEVDDVALCCAVCSGVCDWREDAWTCVACGAEWTR